MPPKSTLIASTAVYSPPASPPLTSDVAYVTMICAISMAADFDHAFLACPKRLSQAKRTRSARHARRIVTASDAAQARAQVLPKRSSSLRTIFLGIVRSLLIFADEASRASERASHKKSQLFVFTEWDSSSSSFWPPCETRASLVCFLASWIMRNSSLRDDRCSPGLSELLAGVDFVL